LLGLKRMGGSYFSTKEGVSPSPGGEVCGGGCAPSAENFSIFELKKASFGACLVLFFGVD